MEKFDDKFEVRVRKQKITTSQDQRIKLQLHTFRHRDTATINGSTKPLFKHSIRTVHAAVP
jgi:hypothetical protein